MLRRITEGEIVPVGLSRAPDGTLLLRLPLLTWRCTRWDWAWGERVDGWWTLALRVAIGPDDGDFGRGFRVSWGVDWGLDQSLRPMITWR